jgi:hypothetical protein
MGMTRALLLLVMCVTLFAQRTPLSVNGTVVSNPNLTNTATVTYAVNGSNIRATSSVGDTLWTNISGTITGNSTVASGGTAFSLNSSNTLSSGNLMELNNSTTAKFVFPHNGYLHINGIRPGSTNRFGVSAYDATGRSGRFYIESTLGVDAGFIYNSVGPTIAGIGVGWANSTTYNEVDINATSTDLNIYGFDSDRNLFVLDPVLGPGIPSYIFDTKNSHTSGNLAEIKNNSTNVFTIDYLGKATASQGFSSAATDAAVTISATGWTNTFSKNAVVYMTGTNVTYTVFNNAGTAIYTNLTTSGVLDTSILLQPSGKVIASGTAVFGRATPF